MIRRSTFRSDLGAASLKRVGDEFSWVDGTPASFRSDLGAASLKLGRLLAAQLPRGPSAPISERPH